MTWRIEGLEPTGMKDEDWNGQVSSFGPVEITVCNRECRGKEVG